MQTALMEKPAPDVTSDQLDLVKRTVANGATADELKLYLYDCARQGVHPLDKLIHFTKRSGKYTPVTSIDFMRTRAADTGEYAGSDDAVFLGKDGVETPPHAAAVTVWRMVQGQRCSFTATARWAEYKPDANDFMWKKMPHTMLAKCAEALALRKGFPRQLAGLYAKEEMDQADRGGYTVEAPAAVPVVREASGGGVGIDAPRPGPVAPAAELPVVPEGQHHDGPVDDQPVNPCRIVDLTKTNTRKAGCFKYTLTFVDANGEQRHATTVNERLGALLHTLVQEAQPVDITTLKTKWGIQLETIHRAAETFMEPVRHLPPMDESEIPF